jgi:hypothetical protein
VGGGVSQLFIGPAVVLFVVVVAWFWASLILRRCDCPVCQKVRELRARGPIE